VRAFFVDIFAVWIIPSFAVALPLGLAALAASRHDRTADWAIETIRRHEADVDSLWQRELDIRKEAAGKGWRDAGVVFVIIVAAEIFVAHNWFAIGRAMFSA